MKICVLNSDNTVKVFSENMEFKDNMLFYDGFVYAMDLNQSNSQIYDVTDYPSETIGDVYTYTTGGGFELR